MRLLAPLSLQIVCLLSGGVTAQWHHGLQGYLRRPGRGAAQYGRQGGFGRFAGYGGQLQTSRRHQVWRDNAINSIRTSPPFKIQTTTTTTPTSPPTTTTTTTTTTPPTTTTPRRTTTMQMIRQKQFSPLLRTEANPYFSIDMERFAVIAAVPGSAVAAPSQTTKARVPKTSEVREDGNILAGFSPVPAVPQTVSDPPPAPLPRPRQKPSLPSRSLPIGGGDGGVQTNVVSQQTTSDVSQSIEPSVERKAFKRCHGKCVQKFCLPIENLGVYDACTSKCKGICEQ